MLIIHFHGNEQKLEQVSKLMVHLKVIAKSTLNKRNVLFILFCSVWLKRTQPLFETKINGHLSHKHVGSQKTN